MINLAISFEQFENGFSHVLLWLLNKIGDLFSRVLIFLPDDPHLFNNLNFSEIQKYIDFIHYFLPLNFITSVIFLSVDIFLTIEIGFLIYKLLLKAADKALSSWSLFFS